MRNSTLINVTSPSPFPARSLLPSRDKIRRTDRNEGSDGGVHERSTRLDQFFRDLSIPEIPGTNHRRLASRRANEGFPWENVKRMISLDPRLSPLQFRQAIFRLALMSKPITTRGKADISSSIPSSSPIRSDVVADVDVFPRDKAIRMNHTERMEIPSRYLIKRRGTMYANSDLAKTSTRTRAHDGLAGNKRVNEKREGKRVRERIAKRTRWIAPLSILMYCAVRTESTALT